MGSQPALQRTPGPSCNLGQNRNGKFRSQQKQKFPQHQCEVGSQGQIYGSGSKIKCDIYCPPKFVCAAAFHALHIFSVVGQCGLKGNVTHFNICLNQIEYRKEIKLLPSCQIVHFKPKIKGLGTVYGLRLCIVSATAPCVHLTNDTSRKVGESLSSLGSHPSSATYSLSDRGQGSEPLSVPQLPQLRSGSNSGMQPLG